MNRRILFRGKRTDNGNWETGCFIQSLSSTVYGHLKKSNSPAAETINVVLKTVGQYTGVQDIDGQDIFEGDIIKHYNCDWMPERYEVYLVQWNSRKCKYECKIIIPINASHPTVELRECLKYKVVGNVYDNPEFLEVSVWAKQY